MSEAAALSRWQQWGLIALRTLVGWHFLYEGYVKLWHPAWSRGGTPLAPWTSAGYLRAASGPFAPAFHRLAESSWLGVMDNVLAVALVLVGLSLLLGLFTKAGEIGALALLALFYLSSIPTRGIHELGREGTYLLVDKNLVEAAAVLVLLAFGTGRIAGLDRLWPRRTPSRPRAEEAPA